MLTEQEINARAERLAKATEEAQYAFWEEFVKHYPEAESGDFDPIHTVWFDHACEVATAHWVDNNVPEWRNDEE